jgi:hypothetical protein
MYAFRQERLMKNRGSFLAAVHTSDKLVEVYKAIDHDVTFSEEAQIRASLRQIALAFRTELDQVGALTHERQSRLDSVYGETEESAAAAKAGKSQDTWAALTRAHGLINGVVVDVLEKMG